MSSASTSAFVAIQESASISAATAASAASAAAVGPVVQAPDINPIFQQTQSRTRKTKAREESLREEEDVGQEMRGKGSEKQNESRADDLSGGSPILSVAKRKRPRLSAVVSLESQRNKTLEASLLAALLPQHQSSSKDRKWSEVNRSESN
jgi:hypothetical protein